MWEGKGKSEGLLPGREQLILLAIPLFTFLACLLPQFFVDEHGSIPKFSESLSKALKENNYTFFIHTPTLFDVKIYFSYVIFELILMRAVPGDNYYGPTTATGHVPVYKANGVAAFLITIITFLLGGFLNLWQLSVIYDRFCELLLISNFFALTLCLFLSLKGIYYPSTKDNGNYGSLAFNFWWGTELYPRILGWDVKQFTNCRFGMMSWVLILISCLAKQYETFGYISDSLIVSCLLQFIYVFKFYIWETGYFSTVDIMQDRAGYYLCWGCMVWLPTLYPSPGIAITLRPYNLGLLESILITLLGILSIYINWDSDNQRQEFRKKNGKMAIWGDVKPKYIQASYTTIDNKTHKNLLLCSGYWGLSRHFHYVPEWLASFFWSLPGGFGAECGHFIYTFPYLFLLLLDRSFRDDARCQGKYKQYWNKYCDMVPYRIVPYIF